MNEMCNSYKDTGLPEVSYRGTPENFKLYMRCNNCAHFKNPQIIEVQHREPPDFRIVKGYALTGWCGELATPGIQDLFRADGMIEVPSDYICANYEQSLREDSEKEKA